MAKRVFDFDRAIVRTPARSVIKGLRAHDGASPTYDGVRAEHDAYIAALGTLGVTVDVLPALEAYPDAIFVEDPALVFPEGAILLNPGAPSRAGEVAEIAPDLRTRFETVLTLEAGQADGGDILLTPDMVYIGLSARTDRVGGEALAKLLDRFGYRATIVAPPPGVLHLKTGCSLVSEDTLVVTPAMAASGLFDGFRLIVTGEGEDEAANLLRINDHLLVAAQCPRTIDALSVVGVPITPLSTVEVGKIDAGLSCMSLRWHSRP